MSDTTTTPPPDGEPISVPLNADVATYERKMAEAKPQPPTEQRDAVELGEAGKKAIQREREARETAERELKAQRAALLKAFGVEQDKGGEDIVATLQQQVSAMQKDNLVNTVARRHQINDEKVVNLLRRQPDEDSMNDLAELLKQQTPTPPTSPAPDPSQASAPLTEQAAADAAYKAFFPDSKG